MADDNPSDEKLLAEIAACNEAALASLFDRYGPRLVNFAINLGNTGGADDAVQECFYALWMEASHLHAENLYGWLSACVRSRSFNQYRAANRHRACLERLAKQQASAGAELNGAFEEGALAEAIYRELLDRQGCTERGGSIVAKIRACFASLKGYQLDVLFLKYSEGLSDEEIASHIGKSKEAVDGLHRRAKRAMRICLLRNIPGEFDDSESRFAEEFDRELENWRSRPLGEIKYLMLDAQNKTIFQGSCAVEYAVLVASGLIASGDNPDHCRRSVLGVSVSRSDATDRWRDFVVSLLARGMHGVELITGNHDGMADALAANFDEVRWEHRHRISDRRCDPLGREFVDLRGLTETWLTETSLLRSVYAALWAQDLKWETGRIIKLKEVI